MSDYKPEQELLLSVEGAVRDVIAGQLKVEEAVESIRTYFDDYFYFKK